MGHRNQPAHRHPGRRQPCPQRGVQPEWPDARGRRLRRRCRVVGHADGRRIATLAEGGAVVSVAFSPNGQTLAAGDLGGHVGLWDTGTGRRAATLAEGSAVASVAFSPNGQMLAAGGLRGEVGLWDIGRRPADWHPGRRQPRLFCGVQPERRRRSPLGTWAAVSACGIPARGQRTATLAEGALSIAWRSARTAQMLAAGDYGGDIGLWDTGGGQRERAATLAEGQPCLHCGVQPERPDARGRRLGRRYRPVGYRHAVRRTATLAEGGPVVSVAFSPDGQMLAAGDAGGHVSLWDIASGRRTATLSQGSPVYSVAFSPNGQTLAAGGSAGKIGLWNIAERPADRHLAQGEPCR